MQSGARRSTLTCIKTPAREHTPSASTSARGPNAVCTDATHRTADPIQQNLAVRDERAGQLTHFAVAPWVGAFACAKSKCRHGLEGLIPVAS